MIVDDKKTKELFLVRKIDPQKCQKLKRGKQNRCFCDKNTKFQP